MIKSYIYTEEEIEVITQKIDKVLSETAIGRFNAECDPREICASIYKELKELKTCITDGCCNFAKKSELHTHYSDSHFI